MKNLNSAPTQEATSRHPEFLPIHQRDELCIDIPIGDYEATVWIHQAASSNAGTPNATPGDVPNPACYANITASEAKHRNSTTKAQKAVKSQTAHPQSQARLCIRLADGNELVVGPISVQVTPLPEELSASTQPDCQASADRTTTARRFLVLASVVLLYIGWLALGFTAITTAIWLETFDNTTLWQTMKDQSVRLQSVAMWLAFWIVGSRLLFLQWRWLSHLKITAVAVLIYGAARLSLQYLSALIGIEPPPYTALLGLLSAIFVSACFHIHTLPITRLQFQSLVIAAFFVTVVYGVSNKQRAEWERSAMGHIPQQLPIGWDFHPHEPQAELTRQLKNLRERADAALAEPAEP